jgi:lipoprotein-releasing system permease protein
MSFRRLLASRYLRGRKRRLPRSAHLLAATGIALGMFTLLVVSSVMNGFDAYMSGIVTDSKGHVWITSPERSPFAVDTALLERIRSVKGVAAAAPVTRTDLVLRKRDRVTTVTAWGVEPQSFRPVTRVFDHIVVGNPRMTRLDGVLIGIDRSMFLGATVGDTLQLLSPVGRTPTPFGMIPRMRRARVAGIVESGMPDYDQLYAYLPMEQGQFFGGIGEKADLIMVRTDDPNHSRRVANRLRRALGTEYLVEDWSRFESNLFSAMKIEKIVMFLVLSLVFVIVSFNLAGNFIKLAVEKKREIGILKAMGLTHRDTAGVFIRAAAAISFMGAGTGLATAALAIWIQARWGLVRIPAPGFPMSSLPVEVRPWDFILATLLVLGISLGACWIAVRRMTRLSPGVAIRDGR